MNEPKQKQPKELIQMFEDCVIAIEEGNRALHEHFKNKAKNSKFKKNS